MQLINETGIPAYPDNPKNSRGDMVKGAAAGAVLDLAWIGLVMLSRKTVKKSDDFKRLINMRCIGEVPQISMKKRSRENRSTINILNGKTDPEFLEAIRLVRSKVEYSAWKHHHKVILITSALAGEGKSTIAVNLALALAGNGKRVALLDCDLRHPSDREILGLEDGDGLYEILTKQSNPAELLVTGRQLGMDEDMSFLFLPGGKAVEDGSRLLGSERMKTVIDLLAENTDYVILDSAPAGVLTDAGILAQYADSVVFVVKKDYARADHILDGMEEIAESRLHLVGGVLNGV